MPHWDAKKRMQIASAAAAAKRAAQPRVHKRAVVLPPMGNQPALNLAQPQPRAAVVLDPALFEPVTFERATKMQNPYPAGVRRVVEAEIDQLMEWGLPRFQHRFPRAREDTIRPMLVLASRGGKLCFLRTNEACALFVAEVTPWEPELFVYEVFVVSRIAVHEEVTRLYRAGMQWAIDIGACGFQYGSSTGVDIRRFAERVGYDVQNQSFTKYLRRGMVVETDEQVEAAE